METRSTAAGGGAGFVSIAVFGVGCLFGGAVHAFWMPKAASVEHAAGPADIAAPWGELKSSLERIEVQLASSQLAASGQRVEQGDAATSAESIDALRKSVAELEGSIERLRATASVISKNIPESSTLHELTAIAGDTNWSAVDALIELEVKEKGAGWREVRFCTPAEILRRFGTPANVYVFSSHIGWSYSRLVQTTEGEVERELKLAIADGAVYDLEAGVH
jgi:hypothetical protein